MLLLCVKAGEAEKVINSMKLINQQCEKSCVVAAISMVTGKSFDEVSEQVCRLPVSEEEQDQLLTRFGFKFIRQIYPSLHPGCVYIASVPSLNNIATLHCVIIDTRNDGFEVFDPQKGREGKKFYTSDTLKSWATVTDVLIREADK